MRKRAGVPRWAGVVLGWALAVPVAAGQERAQDDRPGWDWFGDARLRGDFVGRLPGGRDDLDRGRLRLRTGWRRSLGPSWEVTGSLRASLGTDSNDDNLRNFDNEKTDDLRFDRVSVRRYGPSAGQIVVGKSELGVLLGPANWDADLRPVGASYVGTWSVGALDTLSLGLTYVHPDHPLEDGSESRLAVVQVDWRIREGAPTSGAVTLSYADHEALDGLAESGLGRTNRVEAGRYVSDFDVIDLQLVGRTGRGRWPLRVVADTFLNTGAEDRDRDWGGQLHAAVGNRLKPRHWELGLTVRRIQRDAALAAFSDDDWWFRTSTRGMRLWVGYGLPKNLWIRLSASRERRDDLDEAVRRVLFDVDFTF